MRKLISTFIALSLAFNGLCFDFSDKFEEATLRVYLGMVGHGPEAEIAIDSIAQWNGWHGRRVNLAKPLHPEVMHIAIVDSATRDTIFVDIKSPEFPEERIQGKGAFATASLPKPKAACEVVVSMYGDPSHGHKLRKQSATPISSASLDSLSARKHADVPYLTLRNSHNTKSPINLAIVAEGYSACEMDSFLLHAAALDSALFCQPGFKESADKFNVVAVMLTSPESGITIPSDSITVASALHSHYDSYGLERLLTVPDTRLIWDALEGVPAAHVLVLANSSKYGGSGAFGEYAIAAANLPACNEIIVHEFGHSFCWLADEYEAGFDISYTPDFEPVEENITTLHDFSHKWQNLIDSGEASLIEGAGYQEKGVWRGCEHCLMRSLEDVYFCPVCAQAIRRLINYYSE